jgi:hypothetical protein
VPRRWARGFRKPDVRSQGDGGRASTRVGAGVALVALLSAALAACGSAAGEPGSLPVPTFPATAQAGASGAAGPGQQGVLPDDCTRVITGNDLGALFGLPLDSVVVRTTLGVPAPAVGRTERLACQYTRAGGAHDDLLDLNIGAYTDGDSATQQWRTNAAAEDGDHRDVALGGAHGVLIERPQEAVLMVANGAETLTFVMSQKVRIRDLSAGDTLVDLALRVLPAVSGAVVPPPASVQPTPSPGAAAG